MESLYFLFLLLILLSGLKIKGLTALQAIQLWRLIQYLRNSGKFQSGLGQGTQGSSSVSLDECYKLLGLKKDVPNKKLKKQLLNYKKKIHPDMNRDVNTERLSQLVNEAKKKILRTDFS